MHPLGRLRVLTFFAILFAMIAVPAGALITDHPLGKHVGWRMFRTSATELCVVRYMRHRPGRAPEALDRFSLLGYASEAAAPMSLVRIATEGDARYYVRGLCGVLGAGTDVRMHLRCATEDGYDVLARGEQNECR
jgi:hypothetical protein